MCAREMVALVAAAVAAAVAAGHKLLVARMEVAVRENRLGVVVVLVLVPTLALALAVTIGAGLATSSERTFPSTFEM